MTIIIETDSNGTIHYYCDGKQHRENGPAVIKAYGTQKWWINGQLHRDDGPAIITADGEQWWYQNGKVHREDGPAVLWANHEPEWWLNDNKYSFDHWCKKLNISDQQKTLLMLKYSIHIAYKL